MATETVRIMLSNGRSVSVQAETSYLGTRTGGGRNIEDYTVTVRGRELAGTWDGDARHLTEVAECPADLAAELRAQARAQQEASDRQALAQVQAAERKFYGRVLTHD